MDRLRVVEDPDPDFHFDPDPNADPVPSFTLAGRKINFYSQQCQFN